MIPHNVYPSLIVSNDSNYILFKAAINFAELGLNVWFISPTVFDKIPEDIETPEKKTLQSITFVYLQDYKSLVNHLNEIHLWHKIPRVILLCGFERYTNLIKESYDPFLSAIVSCSLLDSASVCYKKNQQNIFVLASSEEPSEMYIDRFQILCDMYFSNIIVKGDKSEILEKIVNYYANKKC